MSIETYKDSEGPEINIENVQEVYEALDILHSQVLDNIKNHDEKSQLTEIISGAMEKIETTFVVEPI